jgi:hypothetical protein
MPCETIPVLSLVVAVVAVVAVFVGQIVTWRVMKRQLTATTRQTWMNGFREEVAKILSLQLALKVLSKTFTTGNAEQEKMKSDINDQMSLCYYKLQLLTGEGGQDRHLFCQLVNDFLKGSKQEDEIINEAIKILNGERSLL